MSSREIDVWRQNQKIHALKRLKERFGFDDKDFQEITKRIKNGTYKQCMMLTRHRDKYLVNYKKKDFWAVVDYKSNQIVTFLEDRDGSEKPT